MTGIFVAPSLLGEVAGELDGKYEDAEIITSSKAADFFNRALLKKFFNLAVIVPSGEKAFVIEQIAVSATPLIEKHEIAQQKSG